MTKRDSLLAGFTYPSSPMSMPRRHSWRSRGHGHPSSTAAASDSLTPSRSDTDPTAPNAGPSFPPAGPGDYTSHYGYSTADLATPIPAPADHQTPILPRLAEETYPLQRELAEVRRQLHAYYFVEVQSPHDDNSQPALRRLMVTEVDRRGNHRNRQPEFFFNGIIGHIRAGQNGWIDSWDQSSQLANYWRRYFQIPEIPPDGNWPPHHYEAPESPASVQESGMEDTDSIIANVDITPPPVQIHQLATFLWNILNNDRDANMAILERLEDTDDDLSRHPVQIFSAEDLAHLASHLAESTRTLSDQARRMEAFPDEALWALGLIQQMILPCILKPFPLQGTDNSLYRLCICEKASQQRGVCVDHLHRCKTSFCLFCVLVNNFLAMYAGGQWISFHPLPNEDGGLRLWYRDWSSRRTCNFPIYRQWQPAKPSTGMSFKTVSISALLSQSGIFTLFWVLLHQNLLQSKDVESIPRTEFHDGSTNFSCQTLLDCLCTFDAFHISNSIRNFWASVCKLCVSKLCVSKLCVRKLCVNKLCVSKLCVSKLCVSKLCVSKLCVCKLCVSKLCVSKRCHKVPRLPRQQPRRPRRHA